MACHGRFLLRLPLEGKLTAVYGWLMRCSPFYMLQYITTNSVKILIYIGIRISQNNISKRSKKFVALLIILPCFLFVVLRAIKLYNYICIGNTKIYDIMPNNLLPLYRPPGVFQKIIP